MNKAKEILEQALSYKNCDGLIEENSRIEDVVLYAINEALRQPPVSGMLKCCSCGYEYKELIIAKDGNMKCKDCAF